MLSKIINPIEMFTNVKEIQDAFTVLSKMQDDLNSINVEIGLAKFAYAVLVVPLAESSLREHLFGCVEIIGNQIILMHDFPEKKDL